MDRGAWSSPLEENEEENSSSGGPVTPSPVSTPQPYLSAANLSGSNRASNRLQASHRDGSRPRHRLQRFENQTENEPQPISSGPNSRDSATGGGGESSNENYPRISLDNPEYLQQRVPATQPPEFSAGLAVNLLPVEISVVEAEHDHDAATFALRTEDRATFVETLGGNADFQALLEPGEFDDDELPPFNPVLTRQNGFYNEATSARNLGVELVDSVFTIND